MSIPVLVILVVVSVAVLIGFAALMISAMTSKRQTGHHGPRQGNANRRSKQRRQR